MGEDVSEFVGYQAGVVLDAFRSPNGSDVLHGRDNFRVNSYTLKGELYHMAPENQVVRSGAPDSIVIELNQLPTKESHHCKFDDCYKSRRGYEDFCREHKSIGKIISGKIAREEAIAKIASRDKANQVTEVDFNKSQSGKSLSKKRSFWVDLYIYALLELSLALIIITATIFSAVLS